MAGKEVGSYEIDPRNSPPRSTSSCCTMPWSCTRPIVRQGTQKTKTRGEVAGSTKKLYRQKGTGNASVRGGRRSGTRRGGGHISRSGPATSVGGCRARPCRRPRGWRSPPGSADDEVKLVDKLPLAAPKTAAAAKLHRRPSGSTEHTVLLAPEKHDDNLWKSFRNIDGVSVAAGGRAECVVDPRPRAIVMTTGRDRRLSGPR